MSLFSNKRPGLPLVVFLLATCLVGCLSCNQQPPTRGWDNQPDEHDGGADVETVDADGTELDARTDGDGISDGSFGGDTKDAGDADDAAVNCQSQDDCPDGQICARRWSETPVCMEAKPCRTHLLCPPGSRCLPRHSESASDVSRHCRPLGDAVAGQKCSHNTACRSGKCRDGACVARCRTNADCPDGQLCHPDEGFCRLGECQTSCEPVNQFCTGNGGCARPVCHRTGDCGPCRRYPDACESGSCAGAAGQPGTGLGSCWEAYRGPYCDPSTFRLHHADPYCRRPTVCDDKNDHQACPTSFFCAVNAKPTDGETVYVCGQQVSSARDWPPDG